MRHRLLSRLPQLGNRGNVALMTAIFAPLLLLVGGFAIDYGYSAYLGQRLTQATDNAVLASVSQSAATAGGGFANTPWLQNYGNNVFSGNIAGLPLQSSNLSWRGVQVTSNGTGGVNSVGTYTYKYPTFFAGIIGIPTISLTSTIKASANPVTYIDYYILVDVSQSMGIGSTKADMDALWQRGLTTGAGAFGEKSCVFACHTQRPEQTGSKTNLQIAHSSPSITLRIDAAVSAIQNIISDAQSAAGTNKNIRIGLYTINHDPNTPNVYYNTISAPSPDYATLISQATAIALGNNLNKPQYPVSDSDFSDEFSSFATQLPATNGSGASAISPKNYVFIITDGMSNVGSDDNCFTSGKNTCSKPIAASDCNVFKNRATVGTIYTTYIPIYLNNDKTQGLEPVYKFFVGPSMTFDANLNVISDQMAVNLRACSSDASKFAFQASDGPALNTQMRALFASTLQNARLTQ